MESVKQNSEQNWITYYFSGSVENLDLQNSHNTSNELDAPTAQDNRDMKSDNGGVDRDNPNASKAFDIGTASRHSSVAAPEPSHAGSALAQRPTFTKSFSTSAIEDKICRLDAAIDGLSDDDVHLHSDRESDRYKL